MAEALACMEHSEKHKRIDAELMQGMTKEFPDMTAVGMKGRGGATALEKKQSVKVDAGGPRDRGRTQWEMEGQGREARGMGDGEDSWGGWSAASSSHRRSGLGTFLDWRQRHRLRPRLMIDLTEWKKWPAFEVGRRQMEKVR
jgi:hypothetical protein